MVSFGVCSFDDLIGCFDLFDMWVGIDYWKVQGLDFLWVFYKFEMFVEVGIWYLIGQDYEFDKVFDFKLIEKCCFVIEYGECVYFLQDVCNVNCLVGVMFLGEFVCVCFGGLFDQMVFIQMEGIGGQSFGVFFVQGLILYLIGDVNDYIGKGFSGGCVVVCFFIEFWGKVENNIIIGNMVFYGVMSGEVYFWGVVGECFVVWFLGVLVVVEGIGDYGCEYMIGGMVVVFGQIGCNFVVGMSGGVVYVYDVDGQFEKCCNFSMVGLECVQFEDEQLQSVVFYQLYNGKFDEV